MGLQTEEHLVPVWKAEPTLIEVSYVRPPAAIDIDRRQSWPRRFRASVEEWATSLRGTAQDTCDLRIPLDEEDRFRSETSSYLFRTYHCTRLLDHEVLAIRQAGLQLLSEDLVGSRIEDAVTHGFLGRPEGDALAASSVFARGEQEHREGQICLILSHHPLKTEPYGVWRLLATWGGEAIYFNHERTPLEGALRSLGRPTVVVADIDLSEGWRRHPVYPGVLHSLVGRRLGFEDHGSDVFYRAPIPASQIAAIWQPGQPEYDRYPELPRN